jgi:hypothetical protein
VRAVQAVSTVIALVPTAKQSSLQGDSVPEAHTSEGLRSLIRGLAGRHHPRLDRACSLGVTETCRVGVASVLLGGCLQGAPCSLRHASSRPVADPPPDKEEAPGSDPMPAGNATLSSLGGSRRVESLEGPLEGGAMRKYLVSAAFFVCVAAILVLIIVLAVFPALANRRKLAPAMSDGPTQLTSAGDNTEEEYERKAA